MRKLIVFGIGLIGLIVIQAVYAQSCRRVHDFCTENLPDEEQSKDWSFDNQSKSATFEKGKVYEMSFVAYKDYVYRITTCTDIANGDKVNFEVYHNELVRKEMSSGTRLIKEKILIYDNKTDNDKAYYKFRTEKSEKIYVKINVPASGDSSTKGFKDSEFVCVGVLLQHHRGQKVGF
jgi:hypothetical protein